MTAGALSKQPSRPIPRRVLVTGAGGFIGANLVRRLLRDGHTVHGLLRPGADCWRLLEVSDLQLHEVDLAEAAAVSDVVAQLRPQWIFHLAAHGAYPFQTERRQMLETNVIGASNLAEAALRWSAEIVINTGSSSEYGIKNHAPTESELLEPNSDYAVTKASASLLFQSLARRHELPMPTLRLYSAYGPFEEPSRLLPTLLVHARRAMLPSLAQPSISRDFVDVDDVCDAYLRLAAASHVDAGAIYNVSTGRQTTLAELVELVRDKFGIVEQPRWGSMPDRKWDTTVWVGNSQKLQQAVGWQPRHSLADGIDRMAAWLAGDPSQLRRYETAIQPARAA